MSNRHLPRQIGSRFCLAEIAVSFHATSNPDTLGPREGSHAAAAYNALRGEIDDARLAPCDDAMYD